MEDFMKVNSTVYKGIEYVQVKALPPEQQELILQSINRELLIKIIVEGQPIGNCLLFKDYERWFDRVYADRKADVRPLPSLAATEEINPDQSQSPVSGTTSSTLPSGSLK
jgi:hypothetical protein